MIRCKVVLAIGAHPDDIEYGCMGLLLKQNGESAIHLYVASLGSPGDPSSGIARKLESIESFKMLSPASIRFREKIGIGAEDFHPILDELTQIMQTVKPDLILTLGPHDSHQEHRTLFEISVTAARRSNSSILSYGIVSNTLDFSPQLFVDISKVHLQKKLALQYHKTQEHRTYLTNESIDHFHSNHYAFSHGLRYCEPYEIVRLFS